MGVGANATNLSKTSLQTSLSILSLATLATHPQVLTSTLNRSSPHADSNLLADI